MDETLVRGKPVRAVRLPLLLVSGLVAVLLWQVRRLIDVGRWVLHTEVVIAEATRVPGLAVGSRCWIALPGAPG